jgi:hypothetical protein
VLKKSKKTSSAHLIGEAKSNTSLDETHEVRKKALPWEDLNPFSTASQPYHSPHEHTLSPQREPYHPCALVKKEDDL